MTSRLCYVRCSVRPCSATSCFIPIYHLAIVAVILGEVVSDAIVTCNLAAVDVIYLGPSLSDKSEFG